MTDPLAAASGTDGLRAVLPKVFLASLVVNLPMLALLLVPRLMRSRAGSESLLMIGATLYCGLVAVALSIAPRVSGWAAPRADAWSARTAGRSASEVRRTQAQEFWRRVGEWLLLFLLAQAAGFCVAWRAPYVSDNPAFGAAGEPRWIIHYGSYALHVVTIYLFSCLSFAWFGARVRQLALARRG